MNKKLLVLIAIIILLLLGGGIYIMTQKSAPAPATITTGATPTNAPSVATQGTLKALLTSVVPQTCTFTSQQQTGASGTVYVFGGKMRGDVTSTSQGQTVSGHIIIDSGYSYFWTDTMKQGMKIALTEGQATGSASNQGMDVNQSVSYSCKPWVPDPSKFTLPTDVTFSTFTVPTGLPSSGAGTVTVPCNACDSLPAAARATCRAQLNCK